MYLDTWHCFLLPPVLGAACCPLPPPSQRLLLCISEHSQLQENRQGKSVPTVKGMLFLLSYRGIQADKFTPTSSALHSSESNSLQILKDFPDFNLQTAPLTCAGPTEHGGRTLGQKHQVKLLPDPGTADEKLKMSSCHSMVQVGSGVDVLGQNPCGFAARRGGCSAARGYFLFPGNAPALVNSPPRPDR